MLSIRFMAHESVWEFLSARDRRRVSYYLDHDQISKVELQEWSDNYLESFDPLSRLHAKFWGTSMEEEERQWRASQATAGDNFTGNSTEEDDDILPGCYLLDITLESPGEPMLQD
jgi:hypothetical protein